MTPASRGQFSYGIRVACVWMCRWFVCRVLNWTGAGLLAGVQLGMGFHSFVRALGSRSTFRGIYTTEFIATFLLYD